MSFSNMALALIIIDVLYATKQKNNNFILVHASRRNIPSKKKGKLATVVEGDMKAPLFDSYYTKV